MLGSDKSEALFSKDSLGLCPYILNRGRRQKCEKFSVPIRQSYVYVNHIKVVGVPFSRLFKTWGVNLHFALWARPKPIMYLYIYISIFIHVQIYQKKMNTRSHSIYLCTCNYLGIWKRGSSFGTLFCKVPVSDIMDCGSQTMEFEAKEYAKRCVIAYQISCTSNCIP